MPHRSNVYKTTVIPKIEQYVDTKAAKRLIPNSNVNALHYGIKKDDKISYIDACSNRNSAPHRHNKVGVYLVLK